MCGGRRPACPGDHLLVAQSKSNRGGRDEPGHDAAGEPALQPVRNHSCRFDPPALLDASENTSHKLHSTTPSDQTAHMDINDKIHAQLVRAGVRLAASLPDDWVNTLIRRISKDNQIHHVPVCREAETIAVCAGAFFGGVRSVAIFGNTGLLTCTGEMATLCLRHAIPVFCIVSGRGSIDDHKVYQEVQGRRTIPLLQAYDYPYRIIDKEDEIEDIPNAYEWHRLQKRPFVLFLTKKLLGTAA